jgi:hypothetical protein
LPVTHANSGIVHENIELRVFVKYLGCKSADLFQRCEISNEQFNVVVLRCFLDLFENGLPERLIATVEENGCSLPGEVKRTLFPDTIGRSSNENYFVFQRRNSLLKGL